MYGVNADGTNAEVERSVVDLSEKNRGRIAGGERAGKSKFGEGLRRNDFPKSNISGEQSRMTLEYHTTIMVEMPSVL